MEDGDDLVERAEKRVGVVLKGKWTLEKVLGVGGMASVCWSVFAPYSTRALCESRPRRPASLVVHSRRTRGRHLIFFGT